LVSIALVYSQHNCDARGPDYTVAPNTARMSQANDVAKGRHFLYYLARDLPRTANCEPHHGIRGGETNTYRPAHTLTRRQGRKQRNRFRVS
jgi:hypothetical protein